MAAGIGIYLYNQRSDDETDPPTSTPPETTPGPTEEKEGGDDGDEKDDDEKGDDKESNRPTPSLDTSVWIYANEKCSKNTGKKIWYRMLIDSPGTYPNVTDGSNSPTLWCKSQDAGHWKISKADNKYYYYIRNENTKKYLAVVNGKLDMTSSKGDDAKWTFYKQDEENTWSIRNKSGKFLNVKDNNCSHQPKNNDWGIRADEQDKSKRYTLPLQFTWKIATTKWTSESSIIPTEYKNC